MGIELNENTFAACSDVEKELFISEKNAENKLRVAFISEFVKKEEFSKIK